MASGSRRGSGHFAASFEFWDNKHPRLPWQLNSNPFCIPIWIFINHSMFFIYLQKDDKDVFHCHIWIWFTNADTQIQKLESSLRWIRIFGTLHVQLKCHTQHNVYSHLDMYTSDVSRFKYRVNQPRMYGTNRHINTYRVYGSIISTNIHKPGRCTFLLEEHPFFSEASTTSWPFPMCATYGPSILLLLNAHSARLAYL